jgi:hypothetical protein
MPRALATAAPTTTSKTPRGRRGDGGAPPDPIACRECGDRLNWLQPDDARPEILLGVCEGCGTWHVLGGSTVPGGAGSVVAVPGTTRPRRAGRAKAG